MTALLERTVEIEQPDGAGVVHGDLVVPADAPGLVVFAHGSGSSRHSPRNRFVAQGFQRRGLGTLLMDLLTAEEEVVDERTRHLRFDIDLLADRLVGAAIWLARSDATGGLPIGYFGASTGRPDLAGGWLPQVRAPTLLIVGALDTAVIELNQRAYDQLGVERGFEIVAGATHLFEEPGTLDEVSRLAGDWLARHLHGAARRSPT